MKIGIDCRLWNETGVGRYIRNLVTNLSAIDKKNEYVLFVLSQDEASIKSIVKGQMSIVRTNVSWHGIAEQVSLPKILNGENLDLVHFPYFSVPIFYYKPFIVTIHDLIVNRHNTGRASTLPYPIYFVKRLGYHAVLSNVVYRSKKIIVPSNAVRDDLIKTYININPSKIEVTYEGGFASGASAKGRSAFGGNSQKQIEGRYLLRVGNFYPHKNVEGLLLAFKDFLYENNDIKLVLVGKRDYFFKRILKQIENLNIEPNVLLLENVSDSDLVSLYSNATATVVPSFSEGFSLTAVEAMECGSPVIVSDIPVHREICGNSAIYCNPNDINDIKQKINFACSLVESSRRELIDQGKKQSKKFSWKQMASQTLSVYDSLG